jgi:hypothetical protein
VLEIPLQLWQRVKSALCGSRFPSWLPGLAQEPIAGGLHECLPSPAPGEGPPSRAGDPVHVVHGWTVVLPLPRPHAHRNVADVLLPAHDRVGVLDIKDLETVVVFGQLLRNMHRWAATAWSSPCSCTWSASSYTARTSHRASSTGSSGRCSSLHDLPVVHGLPVAVGPARAVGGHRGLRDRERHAAVGSEVASCCSVDISSVRTPCFGSMSYTSSRLPLATGFLIAIHFWRIRKDGGISGPL